jgi:hypothetical protein
VSGVRFQGSGLRHATQVRAQGLRVQKTHF